MINIIGLMGLAGCGKDTVGSTMTKMLPNMKTYALAQPIKDLTGALFGFGQAELYGAKKEIPIILHVSPDNLDIAAQVYRDYGLDKYRDFHEAWEDWVALFGLYFKDGYYMSSDIISPRQTFQYLGTEWGRSVHDELWLKLAPVEDVVITDIRFENEAQYFVDLGATLVRVVRNKETRCKSEHSSENVEVHEKAHLEIENFGTKQDLEYAVAKALIIIDMTDLPNE